MNVSFFINLPSDFQLSNSRFFMRTMEYENEFSKKFKLHEEIVEAPRVPIGLPLARIVELTRMKSGIKRHWFTSSFVCTTYFV